MLITFDVTQEDIDKAGGYYDNENCLGCTVLKRILKVDGIHFSSKHFGIYNIVEGINLGGKFADYLLNCYLGKLKTETHKVNIPKSVLEQIGYFEQKGTTHVGDYINKERNEPRKIPSQVEIECH